VPSEGRSSARLSQERRDREVALGGRRSSRTKRDEVKPSLSLSREKEDKIEEQAREGHPSVKRRSQRNSQEATLLQPHVKTPEIAGQTPTIVEGRATHERRRSPLRTYKTDTHVLYKEEEKEKEQKPAKDSHAESNEAHEHLGGDLSSGLPNKEGPGKDNYHTHRRHRRHKKTKSNDLEDGKDTEFERDLFKGQAHVPIFQGTRSSKAKEQRPTYLVHVCGGEGKLVNFGQRFTSLSIILVLRHYGSRVIFL
jgi:hypothetical protein